MCTASASECTAAAELLRDRCDQGGGGGGVPLDSLVAHSEFMERKPFLKDG